MLLFYALSMFFFLANFSNIQNYNIFIIDVHINCIHAATACVLIPSQYTWPMKLADHKTLAEHNIYIEANVWTCAIL